MTPLKNISHPWSLKVLVGYRNRCNVIDRFISHTHELLPYTTPTTCCPKGFVRKYVPYYEHPFKINLDPRTLTYTPSSKPHFLLLQLHSNK